ncbi:MAG: hypothetical protein HYZ65_03295 [Burkholderiales bacterium]|nr:hypothetical protein [Burkholderiales bacterium]
MGEQIRNLAARLSAGAATEYSCDTHSSSIRTVAGPIPAALARDLEAMASVHQCDTACLTGELLAAAIRDVISALPDAVQQQIHRAKAALASAEAEAHREALNWDPGRT